MEKLQFSEKKSSFYLKGGIVGLYYGELKETDFPNVTQAYLASLKSKDITWISKLFPELKMLSIESSSKPISLIGLNDLIFLEKLKIYPEVKEVLNIEELKKSNINILDINIGNSNFDINYLSENLKEVSLSGKLINLENITNFTNLEKLNIYNEWANFIEKLPILNENIKQI